MVKILTADQARQALNEKKLYSKSFEMQKNLAHAKINSSIDMYERSYCILDQIPIEHLEPLTWHLESLGYTVKYSYEESTTGHNLTISW